MVRASDLLGVGGSGPFRSASCRSRFPVASTKSVQAMGEVLGMTYALRTLHCHSWLVLAGIVNAPILRLLTFPTLFGSGVCPDIIIRIEEVRGSIPLSST